MKVIGFWICQLIALSNSRTQAAERQPGQLWAETWPTGPNETNRQSVRLTYEHLTHPAPQGRLTAGAVLPADLARGIHRFRGYLKPEQGGPYRFLVKGQGKVQLSLSPDESVLNAKRIVAGGRAMQGSLIDLASPEVFPLSDPIALEAGKSRFFEIIFYQERKPSGVSLEWIRPDGIQETIPTSVMESYTFPAGDEDQDDLPDEWEIQQNLEISGTKPRCFATGDSDFDGLTNGQEFLAGTSATLADSDGDTVTDFHEVTLLGSSPLDKTSPTGPAVAVDLFAGKPLTYGWARKEPGTYEPDFPNIEPRPDPSLPALVNASGCGSIEWRISTAQAGFHLISGELQFTESIPIDVINRLEWWIDNQALPATAVVSPAMAVGRFAFVSPALSKGPHTLRLRLRATSGHSVVRIFGLKLAPILKGVSEERALTFLAPVNRFTHGIGSSITSPACVELTARGSSLPTVSAGKISGITLQPIGSNQGWADIPLPANGDALPLTAKVENGGMLLQSSVKWVATNGFDYGDLVVRQGDSLRLILHPDTAGKSYLTTGGKEQILPDGKSSIRRFDQAGEEFIHSKFIPADGSPAREFTRKVTVLPRTKPIDVGWGSVGGSAITTELPNPLLFLDPAGVAGIRGKSGQTTQVISPSRPGNFALPLRISPNGAICGSMLLHATEVNANTQFLFYQNDDETDIPIRCEVSVMTENPPKDAKLRLVILNTKGWRALGSPSETEALLPVTTANEEGLVHFHAISRNKNPGGFNHDVKLILPDGKSL
jgi:hypothetical protein